MLDSQPGIQPSGPGWVKLNTNECPYPPSPRVAEAILREVGADGASLRLYPDPASAPVRAAVARLHGVAAANVCISGLLCQTVFGLSFQLQRRGSRVEQARGIQAKTFAEDTKRAPVDHV